jgi:hypothetical protein
VSREFVGRLLVAVALVLGVPYWWHRIGVIDRARADARLAARTEADRG